MTHTQGKLHISEGQPYIVYGADGWAVFKAEVFQGRGGDPKENARRLVASWNALEGLSTEMAEEAGALGGLVAICTHADDLRIQRDKLLTLLREVSACFTREDDLPDELLPRIDAAIAEIEGATP